MSLRKAKTIATEAAESAQLDNDLNDTLRLLSEAVAEMARALEQRISGIEQSIRALESTLRNGR